MKHKTEVEELQRARVGKGVMFKHIESLEGSSGGIGDAAAWDRLREKESGAKAQS